EEIAEAMDRLARGGTGAIIAVEGDIGLEEFISSGVPMEAKVSADLLTTIFTPYSPLHDGAVLVRGDRIIGAGCVLPLTQFKVADKSLGTRHRAALGLSEETDATVFVVSEETSTISVASHGLLHRPLTPQQVRGLRSTTARSWCAATASSAPGACCRSPSSKSPTSRSALATERRWASPKRPTPPCSSSPRRRLPSRWRATACCTAPSPRNRCAASSPRRRGPGARRPHHRRRVRAAAHPVQSRRQVARHSPPSGAGPLRRDRRHRVRRLRGDVYHLGGEPRPAAPPPHPATGARPPLRGDLAPRRRRTSYGSRPLTQSIVST